MWGNLEGKFFWPPAENQADSSGQRKDPSREPSGLNPVSVFVEPLHLIHNEPCLGATLIVEWDRVLYFETLDV